MARRLQISNLTIAATLVLSGSAAQANDIVDFLQALRGIPAQRTVRTVPVRRLATAHDHHGHYDEHDGHGRFSAVSPTGHRYNASSRIPRLNVGSATRTSFSVTFGNSPVAVATPGPLVVPPAPVVVPPVPVLPAAHRIGEIVTCHVALEPCVEVRDMHRVAPGAVPTVIAVKDPHQGRFTNQTQPNQIVFVQVLAPPCPPQRVWVSRCGTKVRLDFGRYEIDLVSRNGVVVVDYD
ncbi:MAG: hypothetical protein KDA89_10550 [Planctomycetaceae bacterium]|nr:hypothetical protein [Planctomycetaceae bacterium]